MNICNFKLYIVSLLVGTMPVTALHAASSNFSMPLKNWGFQKMCRPAKDGMEIVQCIAAAKFKNDFGLIRLRNARKTFPPYLLENTKNGRPTVTNASIEKVWASRDSLLAALPEKIAWEEWQVVNSMQAPRYPALIGITEAGMYLFAEEWELLVQITPGKVGRAQFSNPLALPEEWGKHFEAAIAWRNGNLNLFSKRDFSRDEIAKLKIALSDTNPIIRKLAAHQLLSRPEFLETEIRDWLVSENTMHDVSIGFQMVLDAGRDKQVFDNIGWVFQYQEKLWYGALLGFSLKFTASEDAVESLEMFQSHLQDLRSNSSELPPIVVNQQGYVYLKKLAEHLVAKDTLRSCDYFSFVARLLRFTKIIRPPG